MQSLKEKIEEYYDVNINDNGIITIERNKKSNVPVRVKPVYLTMGSSNPEEYVKISPKELYRMFNPEFLKTHFMDDRTEKYINKCKENIGFVSSDCGWEEGFNGEPDFKLKIWLNATGSGYTDVKKVENEWIAQTCFRIDIDDYCIEIFRFNKKPTEKMILTAQLIDEIENTLTHKPLLAVFDCWECGRETHWLDINADSLENKWEGLKENYCGC